MVAGNKRKNDGRVLRGVLVLLVLAALLRAGCSLRERQRLAMAGEVAAARADSIVRAIGDARGDAGRDSLRPQAKGQREKSRKGNKPPRQRSFLDEEVPARAGQTVAEPSPAGASLPPN